jgi:hypothetical protein
MNYPYVVGFGHYSRTGKDTTANSLISALKSRGILAERRSFASELKYICYYLYRHLGLREEAFYNIRENEYLRDVKLPHIKKTPVEIWVAMGTPAVRECVYQNTWTDLALLVRDPKVQVVVCPDTRFLNEVKAIKDRGGLVVKVVRPGIRPRDTVADKALIGFDGWDEIIGESGDILELISWAEAKAEAIANDIHAESIT